MARARQTTNRVAKLRRLAPIVALSTEHGKFDTRLGRLRSRRAWNEIKSGTL
jgi:hypothetical protein